MAKSAREVSEFLKTNEVAVNRGIGREAARLLMKKTRGVVILPPVHGTGQRQTRRMPRTVLDSLIVQRSKSR